MQLASQRGYFNENHDVVQLLDTIIFTPSQGVCTPSPLPSNFVWLHPTAVLPHSPLGVLQWRPRHGFSNLGPIHPNPRLYYEYNEEAEASYTALPAGALSAVFDPGSDKTAVQKRSKTRNSKRRDALSQGQNDLSVGTGDAVQNTPTAADDKAILGVAVDWCRAHSFDPGTLDRLGGAASSESIVEFASLLMAYGIPPKDIADITSATAQHHLAHLNARQRRTIKRAHGRAMQALKGVQTKEPSRVDA